MSKPFELMRSRRLSPLARHGLLVVGAGLLMHVGAATAAAQQPPAAPKTPPAAAPAKPAASDAERKAEILSSDCWRRAMFELNEWFRTQRLYTPAEVTALRADFAAQVDKMSPAELERVIADMEAKFKILESPEAREIRAWFGQYVSVLADHRREELLQQIPNFATMTAAQLSQEIAKKQLKRQKKQSVQAGFDRSRQSRVNAQLAANRAAQAAAEARAAQRRAAAYRSPYRPQSRGLPFDDVPDSRRPSGMVDPNGKLWMNINF